MNYERVELRLDDDGEKRWYISTRDGWERAGGDGKLLRMNADHFATGTTVELEEPVQIDG